MLANPILLQSFDYKPALEIRGDGTFTVGFTPTHSSLGIVDMNGRRFQLSCPPAMIEVKIDAADKGNYGSIASAISNYALEIVSRVMLDFRYRPVMLLRGVSLSTRGVEHTTEARYIARIAGVLARGEPVAIRPARFLDLSESIGKNLRGATLLEGQHGAAFRENIERGTCLLREAAERDALTAMSVVSGEKRDFEREMGSANRAEIESLIAASKLRVPYEIWATSGQKDPLDIYDSSFPDEEPGEPSLEGI